MNSLAEKIPGVTVDVAELISVRSRLSGLSLKQIRRRTARSSGIYQTRIRGRGMEYEESRSYMPGDDVRTMDWRVMARTGEPYTKIFAEEKERSVVLVIDLSSTMFFGTRYGFKSWAAAQVAAHIGWLVVQSDDRLGALIASSAHHHEIRPKKNSSNLMRIFHHLADECNINLPVSSNSSQLNFMLGELKRVIKPGSIIILISDLLGINEKTSSLISSLVRHNDLMTFWLHDRSEIHRWPKGRYHILSNGNQVSLDLLTDSGISWLSEKQKEHQQTVRALIRQHQIWQCPISCNQEVTSQLSEILRG